MNISIILFITNDSFSLRRVENAHVSDSAGDENVDLVIDLQLLIINRNDNKKLVLALVVTKKKIIKSKIGNFCIKDSHSTFEYALGTLFGIKIITNYSFL